MFVASAFVAERSRALHTRVDITRLHSDGQGFFTPPVNITSSPLAWLDCESKSRSSLLLTNLGCKPQRSTALRKQRFSSYFENLRFTFYVFVPRSGRRDLCGSMQTGINAAQNATGASGNCFLLRVRWKCKDQLDWNGFGAEFIHRSLWRLR